MKKIEKMEKLSKHKPSIVPTILCCYLSLLAQGKVVVRKKKKTCNMPALKGTFQDKEPQAEDKIPKIKEV